MPSADATLVAGMREVNGHREIELRLHVRGTDVIDLDRFPEGMGRHEIDYHTDGYTFRAIVDDGTGARVDDLDTPTRPPLPQPADLNFTPGSIDLRSAPATRSMRQYRRGRRRHRTRWATRWWR